MPFDQILVYHILDLKRSSSNGRHVVKWNSLTYYTPVKG
jgi:hypothetical protein